MLSKSTLKKLVKQRIKDAQVLLSNRCYYSSIYIAGYALELALKYSICKMYKFYKGFPETPREFNFYFNNPKFTTEQNKNLRPVITNLKEIKIHDLEKLLYYSGKELSIKTNCLNEWMNTFSWKPDIRYKIMTIKKEEAIINLESIKTLTNKIKL